MPRNEPAFTTAKVQDAFIRAKVALLVQEPFGTEQIVLRKDGLRVVDGPGVVVDLSSLGDMMSSNNGISCWFRITKVSFFLSSIIRLRSKMNITNEHESFLLPCDSYTEANGSSQSPISSHEFREKLNKILCQGRELPRCH